MGGLKNVLAPFFVVEFVGFGFGVYFGFGYFYFYFYSFLPDCFFDFYFSVVLLPVPDL